MEDHPIALARAALKDAERACKQLSGAGPISEALTQIAAALDGIEQSQKQSAETQRNLAIQQALLDARLMRVEHGRLFSAMNRVGSSGRALGRRIQRVLPNRPIQQHRSYATWVSHEGAAAPSAEQARAISAKWEPRPRIAIVAALEDAESSRQFLESVRKQVYPCWELCAALDPAAEPRLAPWLRECEAAGGGVHVALVNLADRAAALNSAAALATGEYLAIVDQPAVLSPLALHYFVEALQDRAFPLVYSDSDTIESGRRASPIFRPDWSPDLLTSCMYLGSAILLRRDVFAQAGGFSCRYPGAHLLDLILRVTRESDRVHHVPKILYHALEPAVRPAESAAKAIEDALARAERTPVHCAAGSSPGTFVVRRKDLAREMTAIVCSKSPDLLRKCLATIRETANKLVKQIVVVAHEESGPNLSLRREIERAGATLLPFGGSFNFAAMNNRGAEAATAPHLLFLNDDVTATAPDWSEMLSEQVGRQEVGVAGAVLWYPSGDLEHAGVVAGIGQGVGHAGRNMRQSDLWPWLLATRNVAAVTGACLAIRGELFQELGGFDERFPVNYNDVDICFRARSHGYRIVCVAVPKLIHAGCASRRGIVSFEERYRFCERWPEVLLRPDPYFSASLAPSEGIALNLDGAQGSWTRAEL